MVLEKVKSTLCSSAIASYTLQLGPRVAADYARSLPSLGDCIDSGLFATALIRLAREFPPLAKTLDDQRFATFYWQEALPSAAALIEDNNFYAIYLNFGLKRFLERQNKFMPEAVSLFLYLLAVHLLAALDLRLSGYAWDINTTLAAELIVSQAYLKLEEDEKEKIAALLERLKKSPTQR